MHNALSAWQPPLLRSVIKRIWSHSEGWQNRHTRGVLGASNRKTALYGDGHQCNLAVKTTGQSRQHCRSKRNVQLPTSPLLPLPRYGPPLRKGTWRCLMHPLTDHGCHLHVPSHDGRRRYSSGLRKSWLQQRLALGVALHGRSCIGCH